MNNFLKDIRAALDACKPPLCYGTFEPETERDLLLYYNDESKKTIIGRIDFASEAVTDSDLKRLADACEPATFGRDDVDTLDPTYRKALKLDNTNFAIGFDVYGETGIMNTIKYALFEGEDSSKTLRAELYKLNVYDQEGFFKPHKDTPRSTSMVGSLVIVYPTKHEGGALVLRHGGKEWVFDSAKVLASEEPSIAYVAFFSDVEHEVLPVQKGYRVTITYNLYIDHSNDIPQPRSSSIDGCSSINNHVSLFKKAFQAHLNNERFFPKGGILAFSLHHEYPVKKEGVGALYSGCLKGRDAIMYAACRELNLRTHTTFLYQSPDEPVIQVLCDRLNIEWETFDDSDYFLDVAKEKGRVVRVDDADEDSSDIVKKPFRFINTGSGAENKVEEVFMTYGNEAQIECCYGFGVLVVEIGGPENRTARG